MMLYHAGKRTLLPPASILGDPKFGGLDMGATYFFIENINVSVCNPRS